MVSLPLRGRPVRIAYKIAPRPWMSAAFVTVPLPPRGLFWRHVRRVPQHVAGCGELAVALHTMG